MSGVTQLPRSVAAPGRPARGYLPIGGYAAIGDGRTVALVARDGSIDWLCLPDLDSPSVFAAVLDAERGGRFELQPEIPAEMKRSYRPDTNVLETTFTTGQGVVRVTDALALPSSELGPTRELIRRVDGVAGRVPMRWNITPAFGYATIPPRLERRGGIPVAMAGSDALAVCSWEAGDAQLEGGAVFGGFEARESCSAVIALCTAHQGPLVFPSLVGRNGHSARSNTSPSRPSSTRPFATELSSGTTLPGRVTRERRRRGTGLVEEQQPMDIAPGEKASASGSEYWTLCIRSGLSRPRPRAACPRPAVRLGGASGSRGRSRAAGSVRCPRRAA